jgi:hypothetical protein
MEATRSTLDLINELHNEAEGTLMTALVVGSESATTYVWASDHNALKTLNDAIERGGCPVGYISIGHNGQELNVGCWPLTEFAGNEEIEASLKELAVGIFFRFTELGNERQIAS